MKTRLILLTMRAIMTWPWLRVLDKSRVPSAVRQIKNGASTAMATDLNQEVLSHGRLRLGIQNNVLQVANSQGSSYHDSMLVLKFSERRMGAPWCCYIQQVEWKARLWCWT